MKHEELPCFETEEEEDSWYDDKYHADHNVYDTLWAVDQLVRGYGLEVIIYGDNSEPPFTIRKI